MADISGITDFSASQGWVEKFRARHGLTLPRLSGEADSVDMGVVTADLRKLLEEYDPNDVYNGDETGLFFKYERRTHSNLSLTASA